MEVPVFKLGSESSTSQPLRRKLLCILLYSRWRGTCHLVQNGLNTIQTAYVKHLPSLSSLLEHTLLIPVHILVITVHHVPLTSHIMPLDIVHVDPETILRANQSGQPVVLYKCQLQEGLCGLYVEGTTSAISTHLRRHDITGSDSISTICTWGGCSKMLKKGSMTRHLLTHLGVKVRCSACGVVKCRYDLLRAHITSSELCHSAIADHVHRPEGRAFIPSSWAAAAHEVLSL